MTEQGKKGKKNAGSSRRKTRQILCFLGIIFMSFVLQGVVVMWAQWYFSDETKILLVNLLSYAISLFILMIGAKKILGYDRAQWWIPKEEKGKTLVKGVFCGFVLVSVFTLAAWMAKAIILQKITPHVLLLLLFFVGFVLQSSMEEVLVRGLLTKSVYRHKGKAVAILLPSIVFGALHMANPGATWISFCNTVLVGIFFAQLLFWRKNLLLCCGVHAGWNFSLSCIYGFPVSGFTISDLLIKYNIVKPQLVGGIYGPEASIITTVILAVVVIGLVGIERKSIWIKK